MTGLDGRKVAFVTAQVGVEKVELTEPWKAVEEAGGTPVHLAPEAGEVQSMVGDVDKDETFTATVALSEASVDDYAALVLPGGTVNADKVRADADAVALVRAFADAGKPIAAICHGPWALVEAGVVEGRTLTSFPSLQTDVRNAGGTWHDEEVVHDADGGFALVTSRNPDDLPAFTSTLTQVFGSA